MRDILHCDLNNFFASVECIKRPELKKIPMAVSGDPNLRHGIILAKNDIAKKLGVVTAETVYSAKSKCKNLVLVKANYEDYIKYSNIVNEIYLKYTDRVEKFGIDESFLDVTESKMLFGSAEDMAFMIKEEVKKKTGLTISVGVSFNKSLAKLGSDLKKPDAITVLDYKNYKKKIYGLPVNMLLYVGKSTYLKLKSIGIYTIGDLALSDKQKIFKYLGRNGELIYNIANGIDLDQVKRFDEKYVPKSISKGETLSSDTKDMKVIISKIKDLTNYVAYNLRKNSMVTSCVALSIKTADFKVISRQKKIEKTNFFQDILDATIKILNEIYFSDCDIRSITISTSMLSLSNFENQISIFDYENKKKRNIENINRVIDKINCKYNRTVVSFDSIIIDKNSKI